MSTHVLAVHLCVWNYVVHACGTRPTACMCVHVCYHVCAYLFTHVLCVPRALAHACIHACTGTF